MKVAVIGPGSIGSLLAYYLFKSGVVPTLVCRSKVYVDSISSRGGLLVKHSRGEELVKVKPVLSTSVKGVYDIVLVAVKAYDSIGAAEIVAPILSRDGVVIFFQNGIGGVDSTLNILGESRVGVGILTYGATLEEPGIVRIAGEGEALIGYIRGGLDERLTRACKLLQGGGFKVRVTSEIQEYRWLKLIVNCAVNGLTALFKVKNGVLLEVEEFRKCVDKIVDEGVKVAEKLKIKLPSDPKRETYKVLEATRDNTSSTLQDLNRGRKSEIDFINGFIVNVGRRLKVETPYNELVYYGVKGLESWMKRLQY